MAGPAYLDLAMREYLAMREEMNGFFRLELTLVLTALLVVGGAIAATATDIVHMSAEQTGIALQLAGTFGLIVFLAAVGLANMFLVLEEYVTLAGTEIEALAGRPNSNLSTLQRRVRSWTRSSDREDRLAWAISYGTPQIIAVVVLLLIVVLAGSGFFVSPPVTLLSWQNLLALLDAALGAIGLAVLGLSLQYVNRWSRVMRLR